MIFTMLTLNMGMAYGFPRLMLHSLSPGVNTGNAQTEYVLETVAGTTEFQRMFKPGTIDQQYPKGEYGMSLNCNCHSGTYEAETAEECHGHCVMEEGCGYFQLYADGGVCWTFPADIDLGNPAYRFDQHHELDIRIYKLPETVDDSGNQVDTGNERTAYVLEDVDGSTAYQRMFKPDTIENHYPEGEYGLALNCNCHSGKYEAEEIDECYNYCMMEEGCGYFQLYADGGVCWTFPTDIDLSNPAYFLQEFHELDIRMYKPKADDTVDEADDNAALPPPTPEHSEIKTLGKCVYYDHWTDLYAGTCTGSDAQKFAMNEEGEITSKQPKRPDTCLTADRIWPKFRPCNGSSNQKWSFEADGTIRNGSSKCLVFMNGAMKRLLVRPCATAKYPATYEWKSAEGFQDDGTGVVRRIPDRPDREINIGGSGGIYKQPAPAPIAPSQRPTTVWQHPDFEFPELPPVGSLPGLPSLEDLWGHQLDLLG